MTLARSVAEVLGYLQAARAFPKFALERRLDAFVALYLPAFLGDYFGAPVRHVAPEFPLRRAEDKRSTNVDFLLHRGGTSPAWLFLELKTDAASFDAAQLALYVERARQGMGPLRADIEEIRKVSRHKAKYERLRMALSQEGSLIDEVKVVCLAPPGVRVPQVSGVDFIGLDAFARWTPSEHRELWELLRPLLSQLGEGARVP